MTSRILTIIVFQVKKYILGRKGSAVKPVTGTG